jgi:hypothetical protein
MTFAFPVAFMAPLVYVVLRLWSRKTKADSVTASSASMLRSLPSTLRLRLRYPCLFLLEVAAIALLTVAAARPQMVSIVEQPKLARNIMLVIDASNSMSGEDFPTKLGLPNMYVQDEAIG